MGAWGATPSQAAYAATLWRWTALQICAQQLHAAQQCSASDAALLRLAVRTTAAEASELRRGALPLSAAHAAILQQTAKGVEGRAAEAAAKAAAIVAAAGGAEQGDGAGSAQLVAFDESTARIDGGGAAAGGSAARFYPLRPTAARGRRRRGRERAPPPIVLPAELSLVPDRVDSYNDVCNALRHAVQLCELLSHQMEHVANTYCVRVSLIQHLLTQVIPLPLPRTHPRRSTACFWARTKMRYETQADLLRLLSLMSRHFAACCFSIKVTRSFDAVRLVVVACLATLADAVMRIIPYDVPSLLCLCYSGDADGPGEAFGFEVGSFAVESEDLQLSSPELHAARAKVLDYFAAQTSALSPSRVLFRFERSMELGAADELG